MSSSRKILSKAFVDNNESVNEDTAAELIVKAAQAIREIEREKAEDESLIAAKNIAKDLSAAYSSAIKNEKAKIQFLLEKISEIQGGEVNPSSGANY